MVTDISIVVPNYNGQHYLGLALKSVLNQTVRDYEVIVVDDGSTDNSVGMIEQMEKEDPRLRILVHLKNKGLSAARNTGIQHCRSKYVTFLDSDDLFARERVESLCSRLEAGQGQSIVYTDSVSVGAEEDLVETTQSDASYRPQGMVFPFLLAGRFRFIAGPIALPKKCYYEAGFYDESLRWAEDLDMVLRLSCKFPFLFERSSTYGWRAHQGSSSYLIGKSQRFWESRVLEKHILANIDSLDSATKRQAFSRLFGCYIGSSQWKRLLRMSITDRQAFASLATIPIRMMKSNKLSGRSHARARAPPVND
jgi:glycosyltransferase involved in cell wall biosynthesis